jgi:hypothetical protein
MNHFNYTTDWLYLDTIIIEGKTVKRYKRYFNGSLEIEERYF